MELYYCTVMESCQYKLMKVEKHYIITLEKYVYANVMELCQK